MLFFQSNTIHVITKHNVLCCIMFGIVRRTHSGDMGLNLPSMHLASSRTHTPVLGQYKANSRTFTYNDAVRFSKVAARS